MTQIDSASTGLEDRPVELCRRRDLIIQEAWYQSERSWIIKDPLSLKYCRLREPEFRVFEMLDGRKSLGEIQLSLARQFPDRVTRLIDIQQLASSLNQQGLLRSAAPGRASSLLDRADKIKRQKLLRLLSSALSLRLPGIDPDPLLNRLYPWCQWFFNRWCVVLCLTVIAAAGVLVLSNLDEFFRRLPDFHRFFALDNIVAMAFLLVITKSLHELGHGLFCKHFGGECHEIGFMFLVLTPAMYCDTSDSWTLPNKWHRMAIGAAGMYVEVVLASICTFVWWYTNPGMLHFMCLNVIFLCSVSTLLFNGNPLLRYDGYYILSDWLEVPNLSQKSQSALLSKLRVTLLGMEPIPERLLPQQNIAWFALYSVLSFVYRWFVLIMILWFLSGIFKPYGLQAVGHFLIALTLVGLIGIPLWKLTRFFAYPGRFRQVKKPRLLMTMFILAAVGGVIFMVPFACHVDTHLVLQPRNAGRVHVPLAGIVDEVHVVPGQRVLAGHLLASLKNTSEQLRLVQLSGEVARLENEIAQLNRMVNMTQLGSGVMVARKAELQGAREQLFLQQQRIEMLELRADRDGMVLPAPNIETTRSEGEHELATWSGTPLDSVNRGAMLREDTWFCSIAPSNDYEAVLLVSQSDVKLVQANQDVVIMLDEYPGRRLDARIINLSNNRFATIPRELTEIAGGPIPGVGQAVDGQVPMFHYYQANAEFAKHDLELAQGFRGRARIHVGNFTIAWRLNRFLKTVFRFP